MRPAPFFQRMVIVGVGLIGGSLALACREKGLVAEIIGVGRTEKNLRQAVELNVIDRYTQEITEASKDADLVVLASPVESICSLAKQIAGHLPAGAIITDVGSVKEPIVRTEEFLPPAVHFVGAHPIAGKERSGVEAASPGIFRGAKCIITPTPKTNPEALQKVQQLWEAAGARVICMDAARHDLIFAAVSHLPHVVAYALVNTLIDLEKTENGLISYSAGGLRDFTRIAASHPEMWRDICLMNREHIVEMLERFEVSIKGLKSLIQNEDGDGLYREFEKAKQVREKL